MEQVLESNPFLKIAQAAGWTCGLYYKIYDVVFTP